MYRGETAGKSWNIVMRKNEPASGRHTAYEKLASHVGKSGVSMRTAPERASFSSSQDPVTRVSASFSFPSPSQATKSC